HDPAPTAPSTLSLHDALPISALWLTHSTTDPRTTGATTAVPGFVASNWARIVAIDGFGNQTTGPFNAPALDMPATNVLQPLWNRSEEHTSELQSRENLVCRLL